MEQPLVSVIIPMYNAQNFIVRCLQSVCSQSYRQMEIIVINDGSRDDSPALCRELVAKDSRIRLIEKPNSGVSDTRNQGLELARGKYVQFVDSDDWLLPGFTARLVEAAEQSGADLVAAPFRMVIPRENPAPGQPAFDEREYSLLPAGVYSKTDWLRQTIRYPASFYFGVLWNKLYRRDVLEQHKIRFPHAFFAEDQQFNLLFLQKAEHFAAIDEAGYCYLQNPQSVCHTKVKVSDMMQHRRRMYEAYKDLCIQLGIYPEMKFRLCGIYASLFESPLPSGPLQKLSDTVARTPARKV